MLTIIVNATEYYDEFRNEFVNLKEQKLELEHSLVSLSKWESKWCKPFLSKEEKSLEESIDYIRCMSLTRNVDPNTYYCMSRDNFERINKYIESPMTATIIREEKNGHSNSEKLTSELIYYYMITLNIPFECQKWHLNRLLTLIRVCNIKNQPPKKMSRRAVANRNSELNAARRKQLNSNG